MQNGRFAWVCLLALVIGCDEAVTETGADAGLDGSGAWIPPGCGDGALTADETCDPAETCPRTCEPESACMNARLVGNADWCTAECIEIPIVACTDDDGCCPAGCSEADDTDCPGLCGNGALDDGELCDPSGDGCPGEPDCDDGNACTADRLEGAASACNAVCVNEIVTSCVSDDGCCPIGCELTADNDCSATCGNGTLEAGETCDGLCPQRCDAVGACEVGVVRGSAEACDARCKIVAITDCVDDDGCCPDGCTGDSDSDCFEACLGGGEGLEIPMRSTEFSADLGAIWSALPTVSMLEIDPSAGGVRLREMPVRLVLQDPRTGDTIELGTPGDGPVEAAAENGRYNLALGSLAASGDEAFTVLRSGIPASEIGTSLQLDDLLGSGVSGQITIGGQDAPDSAYAHGYLYFRRSATNQYHFAARTSDGQYDVNIPDGTWDIVYVAGNVGETLPRNPLAVLRASVGVESPLALDIDVPTVSVHGRITLNGVTPPASAYDSGRILLRASTGAESPFEIGRTTQGNYEAVVVPGVYDVLYEAVSPGALLPANERVVLREAVHLTASGRLDINIPAIEISGAFLIDGAQAPDSAYDNGRVSLRSPETGTLTVLGDTRNQTYNVRLVPGAYDVLYEVVAAGGTVPANPRAVVAAGVTFDGEARDIDIPAVTLSATARLDGGAFPVSTYDRGEFRLIDEATGTSTLLGRTDAGPYAIRLVPGTYDIHYRNTRPGAICPLNTDARVTDDLSLDRDTTTTIDVSSSTMSGSFLLDGGPFPASTYEAARFVVRDAETGAVTPIGFSHEQQYEVRLVDGSYDVRYEHLSGDQLPPNRGVVVVSPFALTGDEERDIPVVTQAVSGGFVLNGGGFALLPPGNRARFAALDLLSGDRISLGTTASDGFSTRLVEGTYEIRYSHESGSELPANQDARLGCIDVIVPQ